MTRPHSVLGSNLLISHWEGIFSSAKWSQLEIIGGGFLTWWNILCRAFYVYFFSKMYSTYLYLKELQNCSSSNLAHTSHHLGIEPGPKRYGPRGPGSIPRRCKVCANFDKLQFWSPLEYWDVPYIFEKFQSFFLVVPTC